MPNKSCAQCGFAALGQPVCPVIGSPIDPAANTVCPYYTKEITYCALCNQPIVKAKYIIDSRKQNKFLTICENCSNLVGTCRTCEKSLSCDFETNPSPLPKAVEKRFQQGNQIIVATVKNEERVKETCAKNCECFCPETQTCLREIGGCNKYKEGF